MDRHICECFSKTTTTGVYPKRALFFCVTCCGMDLSEQPSSGAAQRRRQRRLRSMLRHERMSVAMALAEMLHHSSQGQRMARAGEEESELNYTAAVRRRLLPSRCSSACTKKSPAGGGPRLSLSLGRKCGSSGTPWSTSLTWCVSLPWCRFSMLLCRRRRRYVALVLASKVYSRREIRRIVEGLVQLVDNPVPQGRGGGGARGGLQGSRTGQI